MPPLTLQTLFILKSKLPGWRYWYHHHGAVFPLGINTEQPDNCNCCFPSASTVTHIYSFQKKLEFSNSEVPLSTILQQYTLLCLKSLKSSLHHLWDKFQFLDWAYTQQWPQDWKRSVFIPIPQKGNAKECSNYCTIALISQATKVMLKILQARLQQYLNRELLDVQAGFRKGRGTRDQIAKTCWIIETVSEFQRKHLLLLYWLCQSLWLCGSQQTVENSKRDGNTWPPDLPPEKLVWRSRSNS